MHTTIVKDEEGREWVLIHNGDWSGDVKIRRRSPQDTIEVIHPVQGVGAIEVVLPGSIIRQACAQAVVGDTIAMLEQWDGSADAALRARDTLANGPKSRRQR